MMFETIKEYYRKKLFTDEDMFSFVSIGWITEEQKNEIPIREIVIMFYIANEGISIIENGAEVIPIPKKMKDILLQLRDKNENEDDINE